MATSALSIEWGLPIEGREIKALEEFFASVQWWEQLKQQGKIEAYRTYGFNTGTAETRTGIAIIEGSDAQIEELRTSEEFRVRMIRILSIGKNIRVELLETGEYMQVRMQRYGRTLNDVLR